VRQIATVHPGVIAGAVVAESVWRQPKLRVLGDRKVRSRRLAKGISTDILDYNINPKAYRLEYFQDQGLASFREVGIVFQTLEPLKFSAGMKGNREYSGQKREGFGAKILRVS